MKEIKLSTEELEYIKSKFYGFHKKLSDIDVMRHELKIESETFWLEMKKKFPEVNGGFKFDEEKSILYELSIDEAKESKDKK